MAENTELLQRAVKANAAWIDKVLVSGALIAVSVIFLRLIGGDSLTFQGIKIPLQHAWAILALVTFLHCYAMVLFVQSARRLWQVADETQCAAAWHELTAEGGLFMRGMQPRLLGANSSTAPMGNEPATWMTHLCAIALVGAIIPYELTLDWRTFAAIALTVLNWSFGSRWAIALSELSTSKGNSIILAQRDRSRSSSLPSSKVAGLFKSAILALETGNLGEIRTVLAEAENALTNARSRASAVTVVENAAARLAAIRKPASIESQREGSLDGL